MSGEIPNTPKQRSSEYTSPQCPERFPPQEAIERARLIVSEGVGFDKAWALAIMKGMLDALAPQSEKGDREPVAWAVVHADGDPREANSIYWPATCRHTHDGDAEAAAKKWAASFGYGVVPLYADPVSPPSASVPSVPSVAIRSIKQADGRFVIEYGDGNTCDFRSFKELSRFIAERDQATWQLYVGRES